MSKNILETLEGIGFSDPMPETTRVNSSENELGYDHAILETIRNHKDYMSLTYGQKYVVHVVTMAWFKAAKNKKQFMVKLGKDFDKFFENLQKEAEEFSKLQAERFGCEPGEPHDVSKLEREFNFENPFLIIKGKPGVGKSTLAKFINDVIRVEINKVRRIKLLTITPSNSASINIARAMQSYAMTSAAARKLRAVREGLVTYNPKAPVFVMAEGERPIDEATTLLLDEISLESLDIVEDLIEFMAKPGRFIIGMGDNDQLTAPATINAGYTDNPIFEMAQIVLLQGCMRYPDISPINSLLRLVTEDLEILRDKTSVREPVMFNSFIEETRQKYRGKFGFEVVDLAALGARYKEPDDKRDVKTIGRERAIVEIANQYYNTQGYREKSNYVATLAYRNTMIAYYNEIISNVLHGDNYMFHQEDTIMGYNEGISIMTPEGYIIKAIVNSARYKIVKLKRACTKTIFLSRPTSIKSGYVKIDYGKIPLNFEGTHILIEETREGSLTKGEEVFIRRFEQPQVQPTANEGRYTSLFLVSETEYAKMLDYYFKIFHLDADEGGRVKFSSENKPIIKVRPEIRNLANHQMKLIMSNYYSFLREIIPEQTFCLKAPTSNPKSVYWTISEGGAKETPLFMKYISPSHAMTVFRAQGGNLKITVIDYDDYQRIKNKVIRSKALNVAISRTIEKTIILI